MQYSELKLAIQNYCQNDETSFSANINNFIIAAEDKVFMAIQMPAVWKSQDTVTAASTSEYLLQAGVIDVTSVRVNQTGSVAGEVNKGPVFYLYRKDYDFLLEAYPGTTSASSTGIPKYYAVSSAASSRVSVGPFSVTTSLGSKTVTLTVGDSTITAGMEVTSSVFPAGTIVASVISPTVLNVSQAATLTGASTFSAASTDPVLTIRLGPIPDAAYSMTVDYYGKTVADSITAGSYDTTETWLSVTAPDVLLYGSLVQAYTYMKGEPDLIQMYEKQFMEGLALLKNLGEARQTSDSFRDGQINTASG